MDRYLTDRDVWLVNEKALYRRKWELRWDKECAEAFENAFTAEDAWCLYPNASGKKIESFREATSEGWTRYGWKICEGKDGMIADKP